MIHHGDLFDVLPTLDEMSVDACVTDPPYELSFMGKHWDGSGVAFQPQTWTTVSRVLKPGAHLVAFGGTRTFHRMTCAIEDAGFEIRDCLSWLYGQGFPKSLNVGEGRGTALKPAWEPIVLARKPFRGSVSANVLAHGTGALNIDACRLAPMASDDPSRRGLGYGYTKPGSDPTGMYSPGVAREYDDSKGRWPSNVLLDEEAAVLLDQQSGNCPSAGKYKDPLPNKGRRRIYADTFKEGWKQFTGGYWAEIVTPNEIFPIRPDGSLCEPIKLKHGLAVTDFSNMPNRNNFYPGETGGASRFFYVAKPSREERNTGTERNIHPTVKPIELMRWLVKLVTPIGGTVLDPFAGSGTTGMACAYELRSFIGIEREAEYVVIAKRRIAACVPLFGEASA